MSLSRFRCKVKFLSTLSIFPHQSDCQNISSPLHLSVLEHLSIVLSYLFYIAVSHLYIQHLNWIIGLTSKNSTTLLSTNIINNWRHALKTAKIKVYRWSWLLSHAKTATETYVRLRNSGCCLYYGRWNVKPKKVIYWSI